MKPSVERGKVKFAIHLKGEGTLEENIGDLDFANPNYLHLVEQAMEKSLRKQTKKMITEVQKKYGSDIFGFGEVLHKKNNREWRKLRLK